MTLAEFKAWFEGFTDNMEGTPNAKQWKRIQKRVGEIDGETVTKQIFIDRYWPRPWLDNIYVGSPNPDIVWMKDTITTGGTYSSTSAMNALGQADFHKGRIHR